MWINNFCVLFTTFFTMFSPFKLKHWNGNLFSLCLIRKTLHYTNLMILSFSPLRPACRAAWPRANYRPSFPFWMRCRWVLLLVETSFPCKENIQWKSPLIVLFFLFEDLKIISWKVCYKSLIFFPWRLVTDWVKLIQKLTAWMRN